MIKACASMANEHDTQVQQVLAALRRHPRVAYQELVVTPEQLQQFERTLPRLVPFAAHTYYGFLPVLDWDHRLPSRGVILHLYAYYSELTFRAGEAEYQARSELIKSKDCFPEFDVPDYAELTADEAYEGEVSPEGALLQFRFVSPWRRDISMSDARRSVQVARRSSEFRALAPHNRGRPDYLGGLEAVSWTPPCESAWPSWTIDVWYLTDLDAATGKGRSFLVDLEHQQVVGVREFVVRSA